MKQNVKTPWYKFYGNIKKHLDYPDISLYELLEDSAKQNLNEISYNYFENKKTYKEFLSQIEDCAKALKKLGVKKKEAVSICMPNTPEAIISFYALNKIGAIANMIHPLSSEDEISFVFWDENNGWYKITNITACLNNEEIPFKRTGEKPQMRL